MNNKRGMGTGYVTVMLIFALICLTVFAVLSFQAAYADERLSARTVEYARRYYAADTDAKEILAQLDEIAYESRAEGFFAENFLEQSAQLAALYEEMGAVRAEYSCAINERQEISVCVVFYEDSQKGFEVRRWQTVSDGAQQDSALGVWDGTF